jgi:mono/diheme cytochrome c family protein
MADDAGWTPGAITMRVGDTLTLRMTSDDVMHGFAIGQSDRPSLDLAPGKWVTTALVFDRPGRYTFYCTRWCGPNHWRMRGTIDVAGPPATQRLDSLPLFLRLKLDLDAPHLSDVTPARTPSAGRASGTPTLFSDADVRTKSPASLWHALRARPSNRAHTDQQVWDQVAAVFRASTSAPRLAEGRRLYFDHCAACHGEAGRGDGVMAKALTRDSAASAHASMPGMSGHSTVSPTDFTNAKTMLGASAAFLQGKIIRGGMGTGMPYWGPIFTERQLWALVEFLWTFQFDYGSFSVAPAQTTTNRVTPRATAPH